MITKFYVFHHSSIVSERENLKSENLNEARENINTIMSVTIELFCNSIFCIYVILSIFNTNELISKINFNVCITICCTILNNGKLLNRYHSYANVSQNHLRTRILRKTLNLDKFFLNTKTTFHLFVTSVNFSHWASHDTTW